MSRHAAAIDNANEQQKRKGKKQPTQNKNSKKRTPSQCRYLDEHRDRLNKVKRLVRHIKEHPDDKQAWRALTGNDATPLLLNMAKLKLLEERPRKKARVPRGETRRKQRYALGLRPKPPIENTAIATLTTEKGTVDVFPGVEADKLT